MAAEGKWQSTLFLNDKILTRGENFAAVCSSQMAGGKLYGCCGSADERDGRDHCTPGNITGLLLAVLGQYWFSTCCKIYNHPFSQSDRIEAHWVNSTNCESSPKNKLFRNNTLAICEEELKNAISWYPIHVGTEIYFHFVKLLWSSLQNDRFSSSTLILSVFMVRML